jgi:hypothetical protein
VWSEFGLLQQALPLLNHVLQVVSQNLNPIRIRSLEPFKPVVTFVFFFILLYVRHVTVFICAYDQRVVLLFHTYFFLQQLFVIFLKMIPTHFYIFNLKFFIFYFYSFIHNLSNTILFIIMIGNKFIYLKLLVI